MTCHIHHIIIQHCYYYMYINNIKLYCMEVFKFWQFSLSINYSWTFTFTSTSVFIGSSTSGVTRQSPTWGLYPVAADPTVPTVLCSQALRQAWASGFRPSWPMTGGKQIENIGGKKKILRMMVATVIKKIMTWQRRQWSWWWRWWRWWRDDNDDDYSDLDKRKKN